MAGKFEKYKTLRNDVLLVGLAPDYGTANYKGQRNKPPFHGPTRHIGHIRATTPEDWDPETLLAAALKEAEKRGWTLMKSQGESLAFLKRTYYEPRKFWWSGTYGVLWFYTTKEK